MKAKLGTAGLAILIWPLTSVAYGQTLPRALACIFSTGSSSTFAADWVVSPATDSMTFTIAAIDVGKARAQLIGVAGASDVHAFSGNGNLHFLEVTGAGNQTLTTVFLGKTKNQTHPAVHSRHMSIVDPVVSHYRGYCSAKY